MTAVDQDPEIDIVLMDIDLGTVIDGPEAARRILELREVPIVFVSSHSEQSYVDRVGAVTRYGYTADEALGKNLLDLIISDSSRGEVSDAIHCSAETGEPIPAGELELKRNDGSPVDVYSSHAVLRYPDRETEVFCLDVDISERKAMERAWPLAAKRCAVHVRGYGQDKVVDCKMTQEEQCYGDCQHIPQFFPGDRGGLWLLPVGVWGGV